MIALFLLLGAALAADTELWGEARWIGSHLDDFPVDAQGTTHGQATWLDQRIRAGAGQSYDLWGWQIEADLATGQLFGDTWSLGAVDARRRHAHDAFGAGLFLPRKAQVQGVVGEVQVEAGLTTSHWGLGMVANDGDQEVLFGRTDLADRVLRVRGAVAPGPDRPRRTTLLLVGAADLVVDDDTATLADDQIAVQGILSALWVRADDTRYGVYTVFRHQRERVDGRRTDVAVVDGFVDWPFDLGEGWRLRLAAEAATIVGRTDRATTYNAPDGVGILQGGATGLATLTEPSERLRFHLRTGWASGDGAPDNKRAHDFVFDRNFVVGSVLFKHVLGGIDAATHAILVDPQYAGQPPDGVDAVVSEGAIRRVAFLQPVVEARPVEWGVLRVGAVGVLGTAPVAHPFYSYRAGGVPRNHHDRASEGRWLGTEASWALGVHLPGEPRLQPSFEVQGGHAFLGPPLQGAGPDVLHHLMGTARLRW